MIDGFRALSQDEEKVFISSTIIFSLMFAEYIQAAMEKATYEIIDDPEPFYGEVPEGHIIQVSKEPMAVAD
jgi:hypothetical protein